MGVRGLTSFIAHRAEFYLKPYELHDCNLVIDGDNLACNLYKDVSGKNSAFGGDYDSFYRSVVEFFHVLGECNIRSYVLMDGGYEKKKLRTVWQRFRGKVSAIKKIDPLNSHNVFPLMMREVFIDALNDCGIPVMRCAFEADDELAALSRKLNCPVLSYDSDFYIHNVKYIPVVTLTVRAIKKRVSAKGAPQEDTKLTKANAKHLKKRTKAHKIFKNIQVDIEDKKAPKSGKTYKYLDCCLYKIENLIEGGKLSKEKLPLFAALLGNDYIKRSAFKSFYAQMKQQGMTRGRNKVHKRILKILNWLRHQTLESALEKILGSMKKSYRNKLLAQVTGAVEGYSSESCMSYEFFRTHYENAIEEASESENEEDSDEILEDELIEEDEDDEETEDADECPSEEEEKSQTPQIELQVDEKSNGSLSSNDDDDDDDENDDVGTDVTAALPQWFKDRLYPANVPRFLVDLAHLRIYINNPQIEHFPFNDCNEVALPIVKHIFCLLYNISGPEEHKIFKEDPYNSEELPYLRYLTRLTKVTNIHTVRYPLEPPPEVSFDPIDPSEELFRVLFQKLNLDSDKLFEELGKIPSDLRLYFLAIIYWIQRTPHADLLHLHSLLICLVVLRTVDSKVEPIRDCRAFQKRFGNTIKKEKLIRAKESETGIVKEVRPEIKNLPAPEKMKFISKLDCLLVQENLLKHFHMQEVFRKKYDAFSSTVLHGFAQFQSVVFNLYALNGLLGGIYEPPKMAQSYCGVFLYNIYDLSRSRVDLSYFVQQHIFRFSPMMFELYEFFWNWCEQFVPEWQRNKNTASALAVSKNVLKKRKAAAKKKMNSVAKPVAVDPNAMLESESTATAEEQDEFYDLNNKFCTLLEIR